VIRNLFPKKECRILPKCACEFMFYKDVPGILDPGSQGLWRSAVTSWTDRELRPKIPGLVPGRFLVAEDLDLLPPGLVIGFSKTGHFLVLFLL
jgi:hypothetical protein